MKTQEWSKGLDCIDMEIVEKYIDLKEKFQKRKVQKIKRISLGAIAACLTIVFAFGILVESTGIPYWDSAIYSAEEIAFFFCENNFAGESTNAYKKIYVPNEKYLYIDALPEDEYLGLYRYNEVGKTQSKDEFQDFVDGILPKYAESVFTDTPEYKIVHSSSSGYRADFATYDKDHMDSLLLVSQNRVNSRFSIVRDSQKNISLEGEVVQTDTRLSDEEIITSLDSIKSKLFEIFGVSYTDVKIKRCFDNYTPSGTTSIDVYFYDKEANPLVSALDIKPSDFISIEFYNYENNFDGTDKDYILNAYGITYCKSRVDTSKMYTHFANAKIISLKEAEDLLYKGYVFGGNSCQLCESSQENVDFEGYDFVDITYRRGKDVDNSIIEIPFYTFYKKVGVAKNGNIIYAKTYVAAIEASGYDEYFGN